MDSQGPEAWYLGLPRCTRTFVTVVLALTLLSFFKLLDPFKLSLNWPLVLQKFQVWRLFTNFLYVGPFSLRWVFFVTVFSQFSSSLEKNSVFLQSPGSYLYFLFTQALFLCSISAAFFWPTGYPYLADSLSFAIIYYWSKRDMWSVVSIYFFNVKAYQLPFALFFVHLVMGSSLWVDIMGMISGHLYYLAREIMPTKGFPNLFLRTPKVFDHLAISLDRLYAKAFPPSRRTSSRFRYDPQPNETRSHGFIGRGVRLGDS